MPTVSRTTGILPARLAAASACLWARSGSSSITREAITRCPATHSAFSLVSAFNSRQAERSSSCVVTSSSTTGSSWRGASSRSRESLRGLSPSDLPENPARPPSRSRSKRLGSRPRSRSDPGRASLPPRYPELAARSSSRLRGESEDEPEPARLSA